MNKERIEKRFYEIIPALLVWLTIILSISLSFIRPLWVVYFIIIYDLYWLFRVAYFLPYLILSWFSYRSDIKKDWLKMAQALPGFNEVHHLVMLPTYKEEYVVLRDSLRALLDSNYPADHMLIVLGGEERDKERFEANAEKLKQEFKGKFKAFYTTIHPKDLPEEIPGKGSNMNYMGHQLVAKIEALDIDPDKIMVTAFDVDTIAHPQYFACITYKFLTVDEPLRCSYQPVVLYNNNLWESPAAVRVAMFGTTFWLMTELARPETMMTFSSHSMTWRMLLDVGFWQKDIVSEDSRIFLQAFNHYHGDYRVEPIYLPVSMDTVMSGSYTNALFALYKQLRRWAWGVENFPFMAMSFSRDKIMPLGLKIRFLFKQLEGMYTWATVPLLIFLLGQLPFWFAPEQFRSYAVFQNTPFTLEWLMRFAMVGVLISAVLSATLLPPRPKYIPRWQTIIVVFLQWALLPITFVLFGAIPAIDSQTRLMIGKYLGFNVSPKRTTELGEGKEKV
ncbi:MAG: glycosyltransferase family 2 protein [Patescibacteria group bacterium]|nr:glycosyltransferase family 2 protein [Patescibacteria group bacterium]